MSDPRDGLSTKALAQFRVLQQHFVAGLAARQAAMAQAATPGELAAELHRLAGAAASFGFERLGQCARAAEHLAKSEARTAEALALVEEEIGQARLLLQKDMSGEM